MTLGHHVWLWCTPEIKLKKRFKNNSLFYIFDTNMWDTEHASKICKLRKWKDWNEANVRTCREYIGLKYWTGQEIYEFTYTYARRHVARHFSIQNHRLVREKILPISRVGNLSEVNCTLFYYDFSGIAQDYFSSDQGSNQRTWNML